MKTWTLLVALFLLPAAALAQESVRQLEGAGEYTKYLTPGQLDRWVFEGDKGETIIAHVASKEFDPIMELAAKGEKEDKVLLAVDDEGSESRFSVRLPEKGEFKVRIRAFKDAGGGNYALRVQRFQAKPLVVGKPLAGAFDREGKSYHYFQGVKDRILIPEPRGTSSDSWKMLDFKGREMNDWSGAVLIEEDGEHCLVLSGRPDNRYDLLVREARRQNLGDGQPLAGRLQQGEMDVWSFQGKPGDFRLLEVEKKGQLACRLIYAPLEKKKDQRISRPGDLADIQLMPVASRGGRLRFAAILGREGRYQLHLLAETPASYSVNMADPALPVERGKEAEGSLPVSGSAFYSFKAVPGQLVEASLVSQKFVPQLRLYDLRGNVVGKNADGADGLESRVTQMVLKEGLYRLHVYSLGHGGGGDFRLALRETKLKELEVGARGQGALYPKSTDFWAFSGKEGKIVIFSVRSSTCDPAVSLYSPDGVRLASDDNRAAGTDSLMAVKLPKTGRYTVWISSRRGAGDYTLRLIDGD
jgi:hypothetical protein